MKAHLQQWWEAIPDLRMQIEVMATFQNGVAYQWEYQGTMTGPFFGIPPVHKPVSTVGFTVSYFTDGKIRLNRTMWDRFGFLQQLTVLPSLREIIEKF